MCLYYNACAIRQCPQTHTSKLINTTNHTLTVVKKGIKQDTMFTYSLLRAVSPRKAPGSMRLMMLFFMSLEKNLANITITSKISSVNNLFNNDFAIYKWITLKWQTLQYRTKKWIITSQILIWFKKRKQVDPSAISVKFWNPTIGVKGKKKSIHLSTVILYFVIQYRFWK